MPVDVLFKSDCWDLRFYLLEYFLFDFLSDVFCTITTIIFLGLFFIIFFKSVCLNSCIDIKLLLIEFFLLIISLSV